MRGLKPNEMFMGNVNLKKAGVAIPYSEEDIREIIRCKEDVIYFIEKYVKIISIDDGRVPFKMYPYQKVMAQTFRDHQQVICLTCRQAGKCVTGETEIKVLTPSGKQQTVKIGDLYDLLRNQESQDRSGSTKKSNQSLPLLSEELPGGSVDSGWSGEETDLGRTLEEDPLGKKFTGSVHTPGWKIRGPCGWFPMTYLHQTIPYRVWHVEFEDGNYVRCADNHIFIGLFDSEVYAKHLYPGLIVKSEGGFTKVRTIRTLQSSEVMYDPEIEPGFPPHYFSNGILSHNTTTSAAFLLWQMLFTTDITVGILANKASTAQEILDRLKLMYEGLPLFLQPGVVIWNKTSIELANNCKAISAATSSSSIRGMSISCVTGDTKVCVEDESGVSYYGPIDSVIKGQWTKILTHEGMKDFEGFISRGRTKTLFKIVSGRDYIECTVDHRFMLEDGSFRVASEICVGDVLYREKRVDSISKYILDKEVEVYDALNVEDTHSYLTNGFVSHNCLYLDEFAHIRNDVEFFTSTYPVISSGKKSRVIVTSTPNGMNLFHKLWTDAEEGRNDFFPIKFTWQDHPNRDEEWAKKTKKIMGLESFAQEHEGEFMGSSGTLISGQKLKTLTFIDPSREIPHYKEYCAPVRGRSYVACIDVSEGVGNDYSVCTIVDVTEQPFSVSAIYRDNTIAPDALADTVYPILRAYNDPYCIIETNGVGVIVGDNLIHELEYENILMSESKIGKIQPSSKAKSTVGIRQTKSTKKIGCSRLKQLIESDSLILNDYDLIQELYSFSRKGSSYEAEKGKTDDIVMTLVLFGWLVEQEIFTELTSDNIKKLLRQQYVESQYGDDMDFGFIVDGTEDPHFDEEFNRVVNGLQSRTTFDEDPITQLHSHF